jgi:hypothetical protein
MPVLPDWYCCVSVAVDAEDDEWYNQQFLAYMSAGGNPKDFPKRKRREQRSVNRRQESRAQVEDEEQNPYDIIKGALKRGNVPMKGMRGDVDTWAKVRGYKKVLQMPDGTFTDEAGNPVEPAPGSVFVESK